MPEDEITSRPSKATPVEPGEPQKAESVTGRPNDQPLDDQAVQNSTFGSRAKGDDGRAKGGSHPNNTSFAERAKERQASEKRIASASNKAVQPADAEAKTAKKAK